MTINAPASLSLAGNMANLTISTDAEVAMTLKEGSQTILTHRYQPDDNGNIEVNLRDIITPRLKCTIQDTSAPYRQTEVVKTYTVEVTDGDTTRTASFTVLRAGVDRLADTVENFLRQNFLTWQPSTKPVTYYTPEFLTYYAVAATTIRCKAYLDGGTSQELTLATIPAGQCHTVPVQYGIIAGKADGYPLYYDVWAESAGSRLTYIQRYYADDMRSEEEQWILFENSLGGIDTFRAYGDSENTAEHTHNVAEIEEDSEEYRVDTTRKFRKNTGLLGKKERLWLLDFFPSLRKFIYAGSYLRRIVVVESNVSYQAKQLPTSYQFTYKYADARPLLNIPRTDVPLDVLDIKLPDEGSFTVAPRLVEFPRTTLSSGALFPVQSPYSEEWGTTTLAELAQYLSGSMSEQGTLFTANDIIELILTNTLKRFLSKTADDTAAGHITFGKGLTSKEGASMEKDLSVGGELRSKGFLSGLAGWRIDKNGNAEVESLRVRSLLEVVELLINRLQAEEGDTLFTDNDQVEAVEAETSETDGSVSYVLTLKEKWEGYVTAQQYGNILKGIVNTLAASYGGVSDVKDDDCVEFDGQNSYYTAWMRVTGTAATDTSLQRNQIRVVPYGDDEVPAGRNFPPCPLMNVARWGCIDYADPEAEEYEAVHASIERRQRLFYISVSDGRITKLTGVDHPILSPWNFGTTLGLVPDFIKDWPVAPRLIDGRDYLYAQGIIVGDLIKVDIEGKPLVQVVDTGEWQDGREYLHGEYNATNLQWETHDCWLDGCRWRCLQHQPVTVDGTTTYHRPRWNSPYWQLIEGDGTLSLEFWDGDGIPYYTLSARPGSVDITLVPHVFFGSTDISADIAQADWSWERDSGDGNSDTVWNAAHAGTRGITVTDEDLPASWATGTRVKFTCTATVRDREPVANYMEI